MRRPSAVAGRRETHFARPPRRVKAMRALSSAPPTSTSSERACSRRSWPGGESLIIASPRATRQPSGAGVNDAASGDLLVAGGPLDALPGQHSHRLEVEQPAPLTQGRRQVARAVLAQVPDRHPLRDPHPATAQVGLLHQPGPALGDHLALRPHLVDADRAARVPLQVARPDRTGAGDHPPALAVPLVPDRDHVGPSLLVQAGQAHEMTLGQEALHLLPLQPPDLAPPALVSCRLHHRSAIASPPRSPRRARASPRCPRRRESSSAAARTRGPSSIARSRVSRCSGPATLMAAVTAPSSSKTGAPTQRTPGSFSTSSMAKPHSRIRSSSASSSPTSTMVRGVRRSRPAAIALRTRSSPAKASMALPRPVQWKGLVPPIRETMRRAWGLSTLSTYSTRPRSGMAR